MYRYLQPDADKLALMVKMYEKNLAQYAKRYPDLVIRAPWPADACVACGKRPPEPKPHPVCNRCNRARYCSRDCQTSDWHWHKRECRPVELSNNKTL